MKCSSGLPLGGVCQPRKVNPAELSCDQGNNVMPELPRKPAPESITWGSRCQVVHGEIIALDDGAPLSGMPGSRWGLSAGCSPRWLPPVPSWSRGCTGPHRSEERRVGKGGG